MGDVWRRRAEIQDQNLWSVITTELAADRALVIVLDIDDGFFDPVDGVVDQPAVPVRARHAVLAVQATAARVRIRNSWGPDWADKGYGWLSGTYVAARARKVITFKEAIT